MPFVADQSRVTFVFGQGEEPTIKYGLIDADNESFTYPDEAFPSEFSVKILMFPQPMPASEKVIFKKSDVPDATFVWVMTANPNVYLIGYADGTTGGIVQNSASPISFPDAPFWLGMSYRASNGSGNGVVRFFLGTYANSIAPPATWGQVGIDNLVAENFAWFNGTGLFMLGQTPTGTDGVQGAFARMWMQSDWDTFGGDNGSPDIFDFDPNLWTSGTSFTDGAGKTCTLANGVTIVTGKLSEA